MVEIDGLKEELGLLKFWQGISVVTFISLIGFIATNYKKAELIILILASLALIFCFSFIIILNIKIKNKINEIRKE